MGKQGLPWPRPAMDTMAANSELPARAPGPSMFATVFYMTRWGRGGEGGGEDRCQR